MGYLTRQEQVVSYTYDTWGKLISTTGSLASTVGVKNPYSIEGIGMIPRLDCTIYKVDIIMQTGVDLLMQMIPMYYS